MATKRENVVDAMNMKQGVEIIDRSVLAKAPLVSVKMITYNHAPYIAKAIDGVLQQKTSFPIELVIGEDYSTDGTREIVFEYQKRYPDIIRVITSERNVGMKKNSYRSLKACRGKYIAFCEGDDYWHHPQKLQKQVDFLESHPGCGLVHSSYDVDDIKGKRVIEDYPKYRGFYFPNAPGIADVVKGIRTSFRIQTCTAMVLRSLYEKIVEADPYLYQSDHFMMGDTQLWAEIASVSRIAYDPESLATYRLIHDSASKPKDLKKACEFEKSHAEMMLYLCDKYSLSPNIRQIIDLAWCNASLRLAYLQRDGLLALEVKKKKGQFTFKEWFRYYGARNLAIHHCYKIGTLVFDLFRKDGIN